MITIFEIVPCYRDSVNPDISSFNAFPKEARENKSCREPVIVQAFCK
jgi:predicted sulfurtransferase